MSAFDTLFKLKSAAQRFAILVEIRSSVGLASQTGRGTSSYHLQHGTIICTDQNLDPLNYMYQPNQAFCLSFSGSESSALYC